MASRNTGHKKPRNNKLKIITLYNALEYPSIVVATVTANNQKVRSKRFWCRAALTPKTKETVFIWHKDNITTGYGSGMYFYNIEDCISYLASVNPGAAMSFIDQYF